MVVVWIETSLLEVLVQVRVGPNERSNADVIAADTDHTKGIYVSVLPQLN